MATASSRQMLPDATVANYQTNVSSSPSKQAGILVRRARRSNLRAENRECREATDPIYVAYVPSATSSRTAAGLCR